jgi:hypothetical protein
MAGNDEDLGSSRRFGAEDRGLSSTGRVLGGQMIGRVGDVMCDLQRAHEDKEHEFFLFEPQNQVRRFPGLDLKIDRSSLVIWASKSSRRFLGFGLKTKRASVYRLCHKTNGGRSARDTYRDLAVCFA